MISPLLATERTVAVWSTLLHSIVSLYSDEYAALVKTIGLVVEAKADYFTPKKPKKVEAIIQYYAFITAQLVDQTVDFDLLLNTSNTEQELMESWRLLCRIESSLHLQ